MESVKGTIVAKAGNGIAFKLSNDNWYTVAEPVKPFLAKAVKGDTVELTCEKKGAKILVVKLIKLTESSSEVKKESTTSGSYTEQAHRAYDKPASAFSDDRQEKIMKGNSLNAAAAVASSQQFSDPETAKEFTLLLATAFLEWLKE